MNLSAGIVGLPNVGKSTLFNAITNSQVEAANYPFATIEPNVGVVAVKDARLKALADLIQPEKLTYALCQFVDIAGLVQGASSGAGLGNQFLANIKDVQAIVHVVRCFDNKDIIHTYDSVDPVRDVEIINLELILADLDTVTKRIAKLTSKAKSNDKIAILELAVAQKVQAGLKANKLAKDLNLTDTEKAAIKSWNLLTIKPMIYVANVSDNDLGHEQENKHYQALKQFVDQTKDQLIAMAISFEYEISRLSESDQKQWLADLNLKTLGLDNLILATYKLLNLRTFFTFGKKETRA